MESLSEEYVIKELKISVYFNNVSEDEKQKIITLKK